MAQRQGASIDELQGPLGVATYGEDGRLGMQMQHSFENRHAQFALDPCGGAVGLQVARLVRVPWKGIPEDGAIGNAEFLQGAPYDGRGRFAPRALTRAQATTIGADPGYLSGQDQALTGEWDSGHLASLVSGGFAYQDAAR